MMEFFHQNWRHQIVFAKFNWKICYPPPYEREVWYLTKKSFDHNKKVINSLEWERSFQHLSVNEMVFF